jgi:hypothetical protein
MNSDFKIKFDGQQHQIDANVLISSLIHTSAIIHELNRTLNTGKQIEVKIKALEKGSFLVHIDLVEAFDSLKNLLTKENIIVAAEIISGLVGLIALKKFLRGKKEKKRTAKGDKIKIENAAGDVMIVDSFVVNVYDKNTVVKDALAQNFETLENDGSISAYEITDKNEKPYIRIEREDFNELSTQSEEITDDEKIITQPASLNIVKVSFDEKLKWEFYYMGNKITAKLSDSDFQTRIDNGESFAKGDVLEVELSIRKKYDPTVDTFVNKSYEIRRIINHRKRGEQPGLNFKSATR